jgi:hypothetical protein
LANHLPQSGQCLNCGRLVEENFCPACGQENSDHTVGLNLLVRDLLDEFLKFDSRLFRTLIPLFLKPGFLTNEYIAGKRVRYIAPFKLYLFASALFFLFFLRIAREEIQVQTSASTNTGFHMQIQSQGGQAQGAPPPAESTPPANTKKPPENPTWLERWGEKKVEKINRMGPQESSKRFLEQFTDHLPTMMFFLVPMFAGMLKLVYLRSRRYYIEHLYFTLHLHAFLFLFSLPLVFYETDLLLLAYAVIVFLYLFQAMRVVYRQGILKTFMKLGLLFFGYMFLLIFTALALTLVSFALI